MEEPDKNTVYEELTDFPTKTILSKPTEGILTPAQLKAGKYKRVIIVRYTGSVREVILEDYQLFKGELAKGVYQPYEFTWYLIDQVGKTADELNLETVNSIIERVDQPLQQRVRGWFAKELPSGGASTTLAVDIPKYISPLRT